MLDSPEGDQRLCWRPWPCKKCNPGVVTSIGVIERSAAAGSGFREEKFEEQSAIQIRLLQEWISSCPHHSEDCLELPFLARGSEHPVYFWEASQNVLKVTLPGIYGDS